MSCHPLSSHLIPAHTNPHPHLDLLLHRHHAHRPMHDDLPDPGPYGVVWRVGGDDGRPSELCIGGYDGVSVVDVDCEFSGYVGAV
jgi:hypothetical protein